MSEPAWLKRHKKLIAEHAPAIKEEARKKARKRRTLTQECFDIYCPQARKLMEKAKKPGPGLELRVQLCYLRKCPKEKADDDR